jgi:NAD(P)-dependent dehydrogenase (short-subunit alcohol dehydrogenase family)
MMRQSDGLRPSDADMDFTSVLSLNRIGEPQDVAQLVEFLLSDKSSYIAGAVINIDGGWI